MLSTLEPALQRLEDRFGVMPASGASRSVHWEAVHADRRCGEASLRAASLVRTQLKEALALSPRAGKRSSHGTRQTRPDAPSELKAKAALEKKLGAVYSLLRELGLKDTFEQLTKLNFGIHGPVVWEREAAAFFTLVRFGTARAP